MRAGFAANNLAIVRHFVTKLLRLDTSRKGSIKTKRMLAATSGTFRAELLGFMTEGAIALYAFRSSVESRPGAR